MTPSTRLGGFKILRDVVWISLIQPVTDESSPADIFRSLADDHINLPFLTCGKEGPDWGLNIVVPSSESQNAASLIQEHAALSCGPQAHGSILSIFPHKSDPEVTASLLNVLGAEGVEPDALAYSNSAVSAVLKDECVSGITQALFRPFRFSAYRTPADWKLAQKGKEKLYKEVVASYQEKKPKVYGLEWRDGQALFRVRLHKHNLRKVGAVFRELSRQGIVLTFLITSPTRKKGETMLSVALPHSKKQHYRKVLEDLSARDLIETVSPVAHFAMNGPHFGDRYGIASELLTALDSAHIDLLGLSCSIASITGIVPAEQIHDTVQAVQGCFEIPSVWRTTDR
jgi:aspartokinase